MRIIELELSRDVFGVQVLAAACCSCALAACSTRPAAFNASAIWASDCWRSLSTVDRTAQRRGPVLLTSVGQVRTGKTILGALQKHEGSIPDVTSGIFSA